MLSILWCSLQIVFIVFIMLFDGHASMEDCWNNVVLCQILSLILKLWELHRHNPYSAVLQHAAVLKSCCGREYATM